MATCAGILPGMEMAEKVKQLQEEKGITQGEVASVMGRSQSKVSEWYSGKARTHVRHEEILRLARFFGVSLNYLMDDKETERGDPPPFRPAEPPPLSPEQERLLWAAEHVGVDEAIRRVLKAPDRGPDPNHGPTPAPYEGPVRTAHAPRGAPDRPGGAPVRPRKPDGRAGRQQKK